MQIDDEDLTQEQDSPVEQFNQEIPAPEQNVSNIQLYPDGPGDFEPKANDPLDDLVLSPDDIPPKEYVTGFNQAYLLSAEEPKLLDDIIRGISPSSLFLEGFFDGKDQWKHEREKEQENELAQLRNRGKDKDRDFVR